MGRRSLDEQLREARERQFRLTQQWMDAYFEGRKLVEKVYEERWKHEDALRRAFREASKREVRYDEEN